MNIPSIFELYSENKLSPAEKILFEKDISERPELRRLYSEYQRIIQTAGEELYSPLLSGDEDPVIRNLSFSQRLRIEEDIMIYRIRSYGLDPSAQLYENSLLPESLKIIKAKNLKREAGILKTLDKIFNKIPVYRFTTYIRYTGIAAVIALAVLAIKSGWNKNYFRSNFLTPSIAYSKFYNPLQDKELGKVDFIDPRLRSLFPDLFRSELPGKDVFENELKVSRNDYELSLLYLGVIHMERGESGIARKHFVKALENPNPAKPFSLKYYCAMSYLYEEDVKSAIPFLEDLSKSNNPYRGTARYLLRSLIKE